MLKYEIEYKNLIEVMWSNLRYYLEPDLNFIFFFFRLI